MDLTEVSVNAMRYAYDMFPDGAFHVIYAYSGQSTREPFYLKPGMTKAKILMEEIKNQVKASLEVSSLPSNVYIEVAKGETISVITQAFKDFQPDYIVMGTRDRYDLFDRWLGTISLGIVKGIDCPTFLVPRYASYHQMKKVLVATDHQLDDSNLVQWLKKWNSQYKAFIKFLHIQTKESDEIQSASDSIITKLFEEEAVDFGFEISSIKSKDVTTTLLNKAYNIGADLVIAAPDRQSLITTMLYKSITKELILNSKIPLLFLHYTAKQEK